MGSHVGQDFFHSSIHWGGSFSFSKTLLRCEKSLFSPPFFLVFSINAFDREISLFFFFRSAPHTHARFSSNHIGRDGIIIIVSINLSILFGFDGFDREDERAKKRSESLDGLDESDSVVGDLCD